MRQDSCHAAEHLVAGRTRSFLDRYMLEAMLFVFLDIRGLLEAGLRVGFAVRTDVNIAITIRVLSS